jgi:hypothetical protein
MPKESSQNRHNNEERLSLHLQLLNDVAAGRLENLQCPNCGRAAVSAWFTHPAKAIYRTWFICSDCDFHSRAQNTDRPNFFSEARVCTDLEERDLSILKSSLFKRPPNRLM